MNSPLQYAGSKARELGRLAKYIPAEFDTYYEPFVGGGSMFFHLRPASAVLNDNCFHLMTFYEQARDMFSRLNAELIYLRDRYLRNVQIDRMNWNIQLYKEMCQRWRNNDRKYLLGTVYYFLNKTAFGAFHQVNRQGLFCTKFGMRENFAYTLTRSHSELLANAELVTGEFFMAMQEAGHNDFMFIDPPALERYALKLPFVRYNLFSDEQFQKLVVLFKRLKCKALMLINRTMEAETAFAGYIRETYNKQAVIQGAVKQHKPSTHLIVTNYEI